MRQQRLELAQARLDFTRFAAMTLHGVERLQSVAGDADDGGRILRNLAARNEFLRHTHGHAASGLVTGRIKTSHLWAKSTQPPDKSTAIQSTLANKPISAVCVGLFVEYLSTTVF